MGRPRWMDDEEWSEYQMTEEYRYEVTHENDPYDYDDYDSEYADYLAEREELNWREADDYMYEGEEEYPDDACYDYLDEWNEV